MHDSGEKSTLAAPLKGEGKVSGVAKGTKGEKGQRRNGPYDKRHDSSET